VVTQRVGVLNYQYLSRGRSVGLSRLLWEIGPDGSEVRALRSRLGLDSDYTSRQLRRLEQAGLVSVDPDAANGRVRKVRLTDAGRDERDVLNQRSDELAASILAPLTGQQRRRLLEAMADVERLLLASQVQIEITDPGSPAARYCLRSYFEELARRFDGGFDPRQSISATDDEMRSPDGLLLVAVLHGNPVGCGALKLHTDTRIAEIKRMWMSPGTSRARPWQAHSRPACRGSAGLSLASTLRLETNHSLTEARRLYETSGFVEVQAFNNETDAHHWFQRDLAESDRSDDPADRT
jgi:DNA-binding MarR family transcriptional regulator